MPAHSEPVCLTISMVGCAVAVRPPSSSTPTKIPLLPAYSADRLRTSTAHAMACVSLAPLGMAPPNTRMCVAPNFSATSTHFFRLSNSAPRTAMLCRSCRRFIFFYFASSILHLAGLALRCIIALKALTGTCQSKGEYSNEQHQSVSLEYGRRIGRLIRGAIGDAFEGG